MNEALDIIIEFIIQKLGIEGKSFVPFLGEFTQDLDERLYLLSKSRTKKDLQERARSLIELASGA